MRKKIEFVWEILDDNTKRAKVIGGWIVHTVNSSKDINGKIKNVSGTMVFVPDDNHEWHIMQSQE